jgi:hypothetical protein
MAGGIIQLISCGLHDVYLIGNPQITFFKKVYSRYTHFAMESIFLPVDGTIGYNQYTSIQIPRTGDLLRNIIIEMKLGHKFLSSERANATIRVYSNGVLQTLSGYFSVNPQGQFLFTNTATGISYTIYTPDNDIITTNDYDTTFDLVIDYEPMLDLNKYRPRVGHRLMDYVELMIGSQIIDRQESKWIDIWKQVSLNYEKWELTKQMSNAAVLISRDESRTYIELPFWFSKNIGLSLPLIALQYHDVRCNVKYTEPISWTSTNELNSISDHDNPSYVCGKFNGILTLGDIVLDTLSDSISVESGYVAKVSNRGWEWAKKIDYVDTSNNIVVNALKVRDLSNGDIVVAGVYSGRIRFEGSNFELSSFDRSQDVFIAKIDQYGTWLSANSAGGSEFDQVYALDIDMNGNIYISGYYAGLAYFVQSIDGSGITITSSSCTNDIFVAKLRNDMMWEWAHTATGYNIRYTDSGNGLFVNDRDPSNVRVFVTGNFTNDTSFNRIDPITGDICGNYSLQRGQGDISNVTTDNYMGIFVAEVDPYGWKWVNYLKTDVSKSAIQFIDVNSMTLTKNNHLVVVGSFDGSYNALDKYTNLQWVSRNGLAPMLNSSEYRSYNRTEGEAFIGILEYDDNPTEQNYKWRQVSVLGDASFNSYFSANDVASDISGGVYVVGQTVLLSTISNSTTNRRSYVIHLRDVRNLIYDEFYKYSVNCFESNALTVTHERDGYILIGGEYKKRFFVSNQWDLSSNLGNLADTYVHSYVMKYNTFKRPAINLLDPDNCEWLYGGTSSDISGTGGGIQYGRSQVSCVVQSVKPANISKMAYLSNRDYIVDGTIYFDHDLLINDGRAYGDYIYLDTEERRLYANLKHEYLIEQMQYSQQFILDRNYVMTELHFNHPVKELFWTYQLPGNRRTFDYWDGSGNDLLNLFSIQFNGTNRLVDKDPGYLRLVQPYFHHSGGLLQNKSTEEGGYYTYSFALKPEQYQPTGTSNFSRIDNVVLHHTVKEPCLLDVYATNYNVLRITSGMAGVAYSN